MYKSIYQYVRFICKWGWTTSIHNINLNINYLLSLVYFIFWFALNSILVRHFTFNIIICKPIIFIFITMQLEYRLLCPITIDRVQVFRGFFYTFVFFISFFALCGITFNLICICVSSYYYINVIMLYVCIEYVGYMCITPLSCA